MSEKLRGALQSHKNTPSIELVFDGSENREGRLKLTLQWEGELFEDESWDPEGFMAALASLLRENF